MRGSVYLAIQIVATMDFLTKRLKKAGHRQASSPTGSIFSSPAPYLPQASYTAVETPNDRGFGGELIDVDVVMDPQDDDDQPTPVPTWWQPSTKRRRADVESSPEREEMGLPPSPIVQRRAKKLRATATSSP